MLIEILGLWSSRFLDDDLTSLEDIIYAIGKALQEIAKDGLRLKRYSPYDGITYSFHRQRRTFTLKQCPFIEHHQALVFQNPNSAH